MKWINNIIDVRNQSFCDFSIMIHIYCKIKWPISYVFNTYDIYIYIYSFTMAVHPQNTLRAIFPRMPTITTSCISLAMSYSISVYLLLARQEASIAAKCCKRGGPCSGRTSFRSLYTAVNEISASPEHWIKCGRNRHTSCDTISQAWIQRPHDFRISYSAECIILSVSARTIFFISYTCIRVWKYVGQWVMIYSCCYFCARHLNKERYGVLRRAF